MVTLTGQAAVVADEPHMGRGNGWSWLLIAPCCVLWPLGKGNCCLLWFKSSCKILRHKGPHFSLEMAQFGGKPLSSQLDLGLQWLARVQSPISWSHCKQPAGFSSDWGHWDSSWYWETGLRQVLLLVMLTPINLQLWKHLEHSLFNGHVEKFQFQPRSDRNHISAPPRSNFLGNHTSQPSFGSSF